jgi:hypothetical protein
MGFVVLLCQEHHGKISGYPQLLSPLLVDIYF